MDLTFWINAFIPGTVDGYTRTLQRGTHAGKTAVPLPGVARPVNWKDWDAGYLTDQRSFSSDMSASARMHSWCRVNIEGERVSKIASDHTTSGTTEVDMETGDELGFGLADMSRCSWSRARDMTYFELSNLTRLGDPIPTWRVNIFGQAGDPLVNMAADIDYSGEFEVKIFNEPDKFIEVSFDGAVDRFPAYEVYVRLGSTTKTLLTMAPPPGNTVVDLINPIPRMAFGRVSFTRPGGTG